MNPKEDELYEKIGKRIRQIREKKGKTQQQVAEDLNYTQTTISKIEKGETCFSVYKLVEIANYFNTSCETICTGNDLDKLNLLTKYIKLRYDECPYDDGKKQEYLVLEINRALLDCLFQIALSKHIPRLPEKARIAWQEKAKTEFHDSSKENSVSFIPFPADQIVKDNSPNLWKQPELLEISIDNITNLFS